MADILADIHVAEARVGNLHLKSSDSSLLVYEKLEKDIWKRHRVDTLKYKESYAYYVSHPKIMVRIYEKVTSRLDTMEKRKRLNL